MAGMREFFSENPYTLHRAALRRERLPACCRSGLEPKGLSVRFLSRAGSEILLPVQECAGCGRLYALTEENRFLPMDSLLRYDVFPE